MSNQQRTHILKEEHDYTHDVMKVARLINRREALVAGKEVDLQISVMLTSVDTQIAQDVRRIELDEEAMDRLTAWWLSTTTYRAEIKAGKAH